MIFRSLSIFTSLAWFSFTLLNAEEATISGELKTWHTVTLTFDGPNSSETDTKPNPFLDSHLFVTFTHESGAPSYRVPGYFAADGNAGESSANAGNQWRAHLSPDKVGKWIYEIEFHQKRGNEEKEAKGHGLGGEFEVTATDKQAPDFRGRGRLEYVGEHHLQFAGDKTWFLKAGPDAPETMLGYEDFDGTRANNPKKCPLKSWEPHAGDWSEGDPSWQDGKGTELIGALNYLADSGLNGFSFLTYNAGGDGDNIWPFVERDNPMHYDCSKLDQWGIVFEHAKSIGLHLHFKLQETENDDERRGNKKEDGNVPTALDGGKLGTERKLYLREMIARYGHHLALNWNIGEENTQSFEEVKAMAAYIKEIDAYDHPIVIHTYPDQQDERYPTFLGDKTVLTGASLQNSWSQVHQRTRKWLRESAASGKKWVVANDEQNPADLGVPPDPGYEGFDGTATPSKGGKPYTWEDVRRETLWGNLLAGGAGVEYYFGYKLPQNDLLCEDFRSRAKSWEACRIALRFFERFGIPFQEMTSADELVGNPEGKSGAPWCLAKEGEIYVIYAPKGTVKLPMTVPQPLETMVWIDPADGTLADVGAVTIEEGKINFPALEEDSILVLQKKLSPQERP